MQTYYYFVEGQTEQRMLEVLKTSFQCIRPGKIRVFNVVQNRLNKGHLWMLKDQTNVILVFDTGKADPGCLFDNIAFLKNEKRFKNIMCVPQVKNLEEELKRCCGIRHVREITGSKTDAEFKEDMLRCTNLGELLKRKNFDFSKFWTSSPSGSYMAIGNDIDKIKLL